MAAFFSITLAISIVGLLTLLILKHYEMTTGRVVLGGLRPKIGRGVPGMAHMLTARAVRAARERAQQALARAILFFEYNLERVLHLVRQKSQVSKGEGAASQFLQEVAAHKQKLLRRSPSKRVIFDE